MSLRPVRDQGVQKSSSAASGVKPRVWLGGSPPKRLWTLRPNGPTIAAWCDGLHTGSAGRVRSVSRYASRLFDVVIASLLLIVLAPVMAVIAVLVRATSPGPALFRQTRIGYLEAPFVMFKFRTMYDKSDDRFHREYVSRMLTHEHEFQSQSNGLFKLEQDPRITRFGRFLRRSSLDELPQLFNVVRGEMSLVGPRPALPWEVELYKRHHRLRFQVKPGITGLWQVSGRSKLSMNTALDLDVQYVRSWGLGLDLWILMMTLPALFRGGAR
jgi:lipopolysaccharide/colanic/teichoic acid biosynthesis glycosyltransferase